MPRRSTGDFSGGLGRRQQRDRFDVGRPLQGSVYPRKGKGLGVQGEAQYLDVLDKWDKETNWQSWRKGMALAYSGLIGVAERFTAVTVEHRDSFANTPRWRRSTLLLAGFTSRESPEGRWTVAVQPRGTEITRFSLRGSTQREFWYSDPAMPEQAPLRLMELTYVDSSKPQPRGVMFLNRMLIGEVIEDTAIDPDRLEEDLSAGIGLLCVAVWEAMGRAYFDATRYWVRERTTDGRLITREVAVGPNDPLPTFRSDRHLTQATTLSCNCPSHLGLAFTRLLPGPALGSQDYFPQRAPSGLGGAQRDLGEGNPEGVRRRFHSLPWDRIPGRECKHCHAVRFALGAPMEEPSDMLSLMSDYWQSLKAMGQLEEMDAPMTNERFLEQLRLSLLSEQAFSQLDITLLAACIGDCIGIAPQRVELSRIQLAPAAAVRSFSGPLRQNEQHPTSDPREDFDAVFGDWWVGRGTATAILGFDGPGQPRNTRAVEPITDPSAVPLVIP